MPIMDSSGPFELFLGDGDGKYLKIGAPQKIDIEHHSLDRWTDVANVKVECCATGEVANDLMNACARNNIRQWLGSTRAYTPASSRWSDCDAKPMQVFPTKLICNPPATIAFWDDGTKTVAKTSESRYDPYVGLLCCIVKHVGASALDDGESVNGKLNRILVDAGMRYQVPSKFGKHWYTKEFGRFGVTDPNGKMRDKWVEIAGSES